MMSRVPLLVCVFGFLVSTLAKPHSETRVSEAQKINSPPVVKQSREETEHFADDPNRHDVNFDHAAFLGSETAKEYSKLTPEQSKEKLSEIIRKIDKDSDGKITDKEMKDWIAYVAKLGQQQVTDKRWNEVNTQGLNPLPWEIYVESSYGKEEDRLKDPQNAEAYKKVVRQDKRRWTAADLNRDNALTKEEFSDFLNPEDKPHMRDAVIDELLEAVDTDQNGQVSEKEYLDDLARAYQTPLVDGEPEPDWVAREREQYQKHRDIDHNGFMDRSEVGEWIMPTGYDPVEAETQHLFYHADVNRDEVLTAQEILDKQDLFVSSQATNYGTVFDHHEEL